MKWEYGEGNGMKERVTIHVQNTEMDVPAAWIYGNREGKTLFVTLGFDSPAPIAMEQFQMIVDEVRPNNFRGQMILVPYLDSADEDENQRCWLQEFCGTIKCSIQTIFGEDFCSRMDSYLDLKVAETAGTFTHVPL